jgi:hypothetical protein
VIFIAVHRFKPHQPGAVYGFGAGIFLIGYFRVA